MKTILIITSCFLSSVVGRFTPGEIEAEVRKYDNIARRVQGIVDPMYIQVREEKERIGAPLQEAIDTLRQEAEEINRRREACYQEIGALRQANDEMLQRLKERRENRLRETLDPLRAELAAKRVPIIEQVQKLKTEREDIEREHYRLKGDPLWGRWMDGIESMDTGMRMAFKAEAIKGLFASVDGDLPKQIEAKQQEVEKEYLEKEAVEREQFAEVKAPLEALLSELSQAERVLYERINELEHLKQREIDLVMPNPYRLVNEIQGQVINQLISEGDVVTATFTATAAAGTEGMEKEE